MLNFVKTYFKYIVLIAIGARVIIYTTMVFIPKDSFYYQAGRAPYHEKKNTLDVVFIGSSHIEWGIDPNHIWNLFGIPSINYAIESLDLKNSYYLLVEILKYQKPKVVVLDVFKTENIYDAIPITNRLSNVFPFSVNKIEMIHANKQLDNIDKRMEYYFPLCLYHSRKLEKNDFIFDYKNIVRGHYINFDKIQENHTFNDINDTISMSSTEKYIIHRLIELAKKCNISLLFIKTPHLNASIDDHRRWNTIEKIALRNEVGFVNFNKSNYFFQAGLEYNQDIANDTEINGHLNHYGAQKVSRYIGNILKSKYHLTDQRKNLIYAYMDTIIQNYNFFVIDPHKDNFLVGDEYIKPGEIIMSNNKNYYLTLQLDGNLVLYDKNNNPIWASNTAGKNVAKCIMQLDGNLVLYNTENIPEWASNTYNFPGGILIVEDNGSLIINQNKTKIWETNPPFSK